MTTIQYVSQKEMERRTGFKSALGYAFPDEDEILILEDLPEKTERHVKAHEEEHIRKGEEGPLLGAIIGAGASLLGGWMGSRSSDRAGRRAARGARDAIDFQRESRDLALAYNAPYRQASYAATAALMDMVGLSRAAPGGGGAPGGGRPPIPFEGGRGSGKGGMGRMVRDAMNTPDSSSDNPAGDVPELGDYDSYKFRKDPGYQFRLDESMKALERGAAARGGLMSGGFARKALRYASDYASNEYMNVFNRIATIAGFGQVSTANSTQAIMGAGYAGGNAMMAAGEARASGYIGQGNAWANAINEIAQIDWGSVFNNGTNGGGVHGSPA